MCKVRQTWEFLVDQWHLHALLFPEVAVAREEKGAVYSVNWRGKKERKKWTFMLSSLLILDPDFFWC